MLKFLLSRYLTRFERTWDFDTSFMREILAANLGSFLKLLLGTGAADAKAVPREATLAATFAGVLSEDCGACTQLGVDMASANGAKAEVLRAILAGDEAGMGETASLSWRFARASLARDMEACAPLREEIVRRWGEKGSDIHQPKPDCFAHLPDAEVRARSWQGVLAGHGRGRRGACNPRSTRDVRLPIAAWEAQSNAGKAARTWRSVT